MKKYIYFSAILSLCSYPLIAQDWRSMMKDQNANVHDVQKAFYDWYAKQPKNEKVKPGEKENEEDGAYQQFKRWEWQMDIRTYPSGNRPKPGQIGAEYQNYLRQQNASHRSANAQSVANWTYVGNVSVPPAGPSGNYDGGDGRVNYFRFMPGNSNTIFACCPTGGLWETTNGGTTWSTKTDQISDLSVSDVAIDPSNTNIMYISTGDGDGIFGGYTTLSTVGVLKSTDGGNTWNPTGLSYSQAVTGPLFQTVNQLLIHPTTTSILLAATSFGLYRTTNSGANWTQVDTGDFRSIEYEPSHPSIMFAGTFNGQFYRSTNAGSTWTRITAGLPAGFTPQQRIKIAVTPADSTYVYVIEWQNGIYRSTNKGVSFSLQSNFDPIGGQGWYNLGFNVSQTNRDSLLAGGLDNYVSTNGGGTWTQITSWVASGHPYVHADVHCINWLPGSGSTYFVGCDGGMFKYTKSLPGVWTDISHNLEIAEIYSIGPSAITPNQWITGWQDNGVYVSNPSWKNVLGGDGMVSFIDYNNDANWFGENYGGDLQFSNDGGNTWSYIYPPVAGGPWVTRWMQDPMNFNYIYAAYNDAWESPDQGVTWNQISFWGNPSVYMSAIAVDAGNDNVIMAANPGMIQRTPDNGTTWTDVTPGLPVANAGISAIAIDPNNSRHAWVAFSGYVAADKVFFTKDSGAHWTNISTGLPNLPVNCILYQPASNGGIYVGTDAGVYYHDTALNAWVNYSQGLPNVIVNDIKYTAAPATIIAATYGRGVWSSAAYTSSPLGVNKVLADNQVKVYPNPTSGIVNLTLDLPVNGQYNIIVCNLLGQTIYSNKINANGQYTGKIDLSSFAKGTYVLMINGQGYRMERKIVTE